MKKTVSQLWEDIFLDYNILEKTKENSCFVITKEILKHKPFYKVYDYYLKNGNIPDKDYIKDILMETIPQLSLETINRRASTIRGWIQWVIGSQL